jgi:hypothetical protein
MRVIHILYGQSLIVCTTLNTTDVVVYFFRVGKKGLYPTLLDTVVSKQQ